MAKVVFIIPDAWTLFSDPPRTSGGAELDLFNIANGLARREHQCVFIVSRPRRDDTQPEWRPKSNNVETASKHSLRKISLFTRVPIVGGVLNTMRLWLTLSRERPDAVMVKGAGLMVFQVGLWAKITRTKFLWRASHEQNFEPAFLKRRWWYWPYRLGLKWANTIICQTHDQRRLLNRNFGLDGDVVYNGHPIPKSTQIIPMSKRRGIIWVGRGQQIKQPLLAVEIAERFPTVPMTLIVGDPNAPLNGAIRVKAGQYPNITLYENIPLDQAEALVASSRVAVLTSLKEGLSNFFIQSLKWQVPMVSLHVNPDNLMNEKYGSVFCNGSLKVMEESIAKILSDDRFASQLSIAAGKAAKKFFSIEKVIDYYERILRHS